MKILLVGGSGLLGKKLLETPPPNVELIPTFYNIHLPNKDGIKLNIVDRVAVHQIVALIKPDLIIHCASLVYVDYCERHEQLTWDINVTGTQHLLEAAQAVNAKFFFFSSNGIFDGTNPPYKEEDTANPINVYGKTKYIAEQLVIKHYKTKSIIFRLNTMYGWNFPHSRENPVSWLLKRLRENKKTYMVNDVYNSHLWVGQAARAVWKAIKKQCYSELFHVGGADCISRYALSKVIAQVFHLNKKLLHSVESTYFPNIAPRATNTCFDSTKMMHMLDIEPISVRAGLSQMKKEQTSV